ncbi:hypothetical protein GCM10015536_74840 [Streptomyces griseomycini]|nr:hypothetical protein GCM10015536_74840 [Streptomyces griseomycini]
MQEDDGAGARVLRATIEVINHVFYCLSAVPRQASGNRPGPGASRGTQRSEYRRASRMAVSTVTTYRCTENTEPPQAFDLLKRVKDRHPVMLISASSGAYIGIL